MAQTAEVRRVVRRLLAATPAYSQLPPDKQRQISHDMVRVAAYMADPHGLVSKESRQPVLTIQATKGKERASMSRRASRPWGDGVDAMTHQLSSVEFPQFVGALINGVFHAIVDASIQQMQAYGKLVSDVAKSVDAFVKDALTDDDARDYLASHFPDQFCARSGSRKGLRWRGDAEQGARVLRAALDLPAAPADTKELVMATRRRMAFQRQQALMTRVLMGINRIVVADGKINAK
jgi:hypothetical protein